MQRLCVEGMLRTGVLFWWMLVVILLFEIVVQNHFVEGLVHPNLSIARKVAPDKGGDDVMPLLVDLCIAGEGASGYLQTRVPGCQASCKVNVR